MNPENITYVARIFQRIGDNGFVKLLAGVLLFLLRFFFDSVNTLAMAAVFVLILMDTATGLLGAYRSGAPIQSHKLFRLAVKFAVYGTLMSAGRVVEYTIPIGVIDETIIAALAITELFSILENTARAGFTVASRLLIKFQKQIDP